MDFGKEKHNEMRANEKLVFSMKVLVTQSCPTLCNSMDCSPPDSSVHGILQASILEWAAILSSRGYFWPGDQAWVSCFVCTLFPV